MNISSKRWSSSSEAFYFVEQVGTAASEKHQMNYRFNIKKGVIENRYLDEK